MRALGPVMVSSALLFVLGAAGLHPASAAAAVPEESTVGLGAPVLIAEFYPCAVDGDEYLVLRNCGPEAVNLLGWSLCDGEGSIGLPEVYLGPGQRFAVSEDGSSYAKAFGARPDLSVDGWSGDGSVTVSGSFRLSDAGEVLWLALPDGSAADVVAYGSANLPAPGWEGPALPGPREGEVARRVSSGNGLQDTDCGADWMPFREYRYGYTEHGLVTASLPPGSLTAFTSPDCSLDVVRGALSSAVESVRLCSYELSSSTVCRLLRDAQLRGVDVRVLVDACPVGGMSARQIGCLSALASEGVDVKVIGGSLQDGVVRHVGVMHAKYMVVDGSSLLVLSENFVEEGVPVDRLFGNRGWGILAEDPVLASAACKVFDDDSRPDRPCVWAWAEDERYDPGPELPDDPPSEHPAGVLAPYVSRSWSEVSLYLSPDMSPEEPFLSHIVSEASSILFEQFRADLLWTYRWSGETRVSPVIERLMEALERGADVMGVLDGSWFNLEGNGAVVDRLSWAAAACGREPAFCLMHEGSPVASLHNKGMAMSDGALVSSNNWVYASFARNRELAALVRDEGVASYFSGAFMLDWVPDSRPPVASAGDDIVLAGPEEVVLDASSSWDDRAIASFEWDFDGDGLADASGQEVVFTPPSEGAHTVRLTVVDSWGNAATDDLVVTVGAAGSAPEASARPGPPYYWLLPAASSLAAVALVAARKVNLPRGRIGRQG